MKVRGAAVHKQMYCQTVHTTHNCTRLFCLSLYCDMTVIKITNILIHTDIHTDTPVLQRVQLVIINNSSYK